MPPTTDSTETVADSSSSPVLEHGEDRGKGFIAEDAHRIDDPEAQFSCEEAAAVRGLAVPSRTRSRPGQIVISWEPNDPENPYNWSSLKKITSVLIAAMVVINSTMGSSLPSMAIPAITNQFHVTSQEQDFLPISVYLIGYVVGPTVWGPLSEQFGRRDLSLATFAVFSLFTMACALAPNWPALLVFRLICGICASSPIAIVAGILADLYNEPRTRGKAFAVFMVATTFGPILSPVISGFASPAIGWRWVFWIGFIFSGVSFVMLFFLPETYGPVLLSRRAEKLRRRRRAALALALRSGEEDASSPTADIFAPRDLEDAHLSHLLTVVLTRPFSMIVHEPIVSTTCAYLSLVYAIFYMSFQAFPIIFQSLYGLSPGVAGLAYLPISFGAVLSILVFWVWDDVLARAVAREAPWTAREEYRRLPLACLAGPLFVVSLFWLGFTSRPSIPFFVPMLAGIPFGMGYLLVFMALLNYLTDAYEVFAASANAAASTCRSLSAVVLPLATTPMFAKLGISGACSLLGGLSACMCIIPFIFIWKGPSIRSRSRFCLALRERKEEMLRKAEEEKERLERAAVSRNEEAV